MHDFDADAYFRKTLHVCMYSGRKINGKFKVEEGTPFQFISNLLFIFLELFRELIVYHEFSARSNMSQGGKPLRSLV